MKKILALLMLMVAFVKANAQHDFKTFLKARVLLYCYETCYNGQVIDMRPYEKYHDVNLGFNNYKKSILFLRYYYQQKQFDKVRSELDSAVARGLFLNNIPQEIRNDKNVWNQGMYEKSRNQYLATIDTGLLKQLVAIDDSDQFVRQSEAPPTRAIYEAMKSVDNRNYYKLAALTKQYGWLGEERFDKYNNPDSCLYELTPMISHFTRQQIIYFRNLAVSYATAGKISWDAAVVLEHAVLWRHDTINGPVVKGLYSVSGLFPLELTGLKQNGEVNWQYSQFELYTLGHVMLAGMAQLKIELYPTGKMLQQYPEQAESALIAIKEYFVQAGAKAENISILKSCPYPQGDWHDVLFGYKIGRATAGRMNWFNPYGLRIGG